MGSELSTEGILATADYKTDVIFVIVAMTEEEASKLINGEALDRPSVSPGDKSAFNTFRDILAKEHEFTDFNGRFGQTRDDWKPNRDSDESIKELICTICGNFPYYAPNGKRIIINPYFLSSQFFEKENDNIRRNTWDLINERGGIMIADALSLYHPEIADPFFQSGAGFNKKVAILVHSPVNLLTGHINDLITGLFASKYKRIYDRFDANCDRLCEIGVGDPCSFRRWLYSTLLDVVPNNAMSPLNHEIMIKHIGPKFGMNTHIFSGGQ